MSRRITQRQLRNDSGRIMRALDRGKSFVITRNGVPVGELIPLQGRTFVPADVAVGAFAGSPRPGRTCAEIDEDRSVDQPTWVTLVSHACGPAASSAIVTADTASSSGKA